MSDLKELSQSQVPLERVAPLNSNRLVTFVNHFIVSIVQQLNELSSVVDSRLFDINNQILRCNANLVILEMKLNSISGLSSVPSVPSVANTDNNQNNVQINNLPQNIENNIPKESAETEIEVELNTTQTTNETTEQINEESEVIDEEPEPQLEDPMIAKYKKMVQLGIPLQAVHHKMRMEGIDPQLLPA